MTDMDMRGRIGSMLLALAIAGCSSTLFESPPAGKAGCDQRLVGQWRIGEWPAQAAGPAADSPADEGDDTYLRITRSCRILDLRTGRRPSDLSEVGNLSFLRIGTVDYAYTLHEERKPDGANRERPARTGYVVLRYQVTGDRVLLYPADHRRIARMIRSKQVPGMTDDSSDVAQVREEGVAPAINNFIPGSREQVKALLVALPDLFASAPTGVLVRFPGVPPPLTDRRDQ